MPDELMLPSFEDNLPPTIQGLSDLLGKTLLAITRHPSATAEEKQSCLSTADAFIRTALVSLNAQAASVVPPTVFSPNWDAVQSLADLKSLLMPLQFQYTNQCPTLDSFRHLLQPVDL